MKSFALTSERLKNWNWTLIEKLLSVEKIRFCDKKTSIFFWKNKFFWVKWNTFLWQNRITRLFLFAKKLLFFLLQKTFISAAKILVFLSQKRTFFYRKRFFYEWRLDVELYNSFKKIGYSDIELKYKNWILNFTCMCRNWLGKLVHRLQDVSASVLRMFYRNLSTF